MTTTTSKLVLGVDLAKIDDVKLREAYKEALGKDSPKELEPTVRDLASHFQKVSKRLMECEGCGGGSPPDYDHCPFCGSFDEANDDNEADVPDDISDVPDVPESKDDTAIDASVLLSSTNGLHTNTPINVPSTVKIDRSKKKEAKAVAKAPTVPTAIVVRTEKDLDHRLDNIRKLRRETSSSLWTLGEEVRAIYEGELWMQRLEGGKPKYKTFNQFIEAEVGLHPNTAWRLMQTTIEFKRAQFDAHGPTILRALLAAPKETREELIAKIESGEVSGSRSVEREVRAIRERAHVEVITDTSSKKKGRGKGAATAAAAASTKAAARRAQTITVPFPTAKMKIDAFVRQIRKTDPPKRAKKLADKPWGKIELSNGVVLFVTIELSAAGELRFIVGASREE